MEIKPLTHITLHRYFEQIKDAIVDYVAKTDPWLTSEAVLDHLMYSLPQGLVLVAEENDKLFGFVVCYLERTRFGLCLFVLHLWISRTAPKDTYKKGWEEIEKLAEKFDCHSIACETQVGKRWTCYYKKRLKKLGFVPAKIVYRRFL